MNKKEILTILQETYKSTIKEVYVDCPSPELVEMYFTITDLLLDPTFTPKTLGLTYATIKYWEKSEYLILPIEKETDEWRKYCLLEVLWFQILKKFVSMGCTLDSIAPKLILAYTNLNSGDSSVELKPDIILNIEHSSGIKIDPLITFLGHVVEILIRRSKAAIHFIDKQCQFYFEKDSSEKAISTEQAYTTLFSTGISICLSDIVFESIAGLEYVKEDRVDIFNKTELEILKLLRRRELKEITIKLEDGKPIHIELKEKFDINGEDLSKRLKEFFFSPYQEIKAVTNNGKIVHIERITKKKLND